MARSINSEPARVYRNSRNDARTRVSLPPQIPTIRKRGTRTLSKKM